MIRIPLTEAELIASLQPGEEVQIFSGDRNVAGLIGEIQPPRKPGSAIGTLTILSQDEIHLEDFHDYMP